MPEQSITIGGKTFDVACQPGEEQYLLAAAAQLDAEARTLISQIGRLPESRMLLMAGLMLADRTAGLEDRLRAAEDALARARSDLDAALSAPRPAPSRVEVPVVPAQIVESLAELAARAESIAAQLEERAAP